MTDVLNNPWVSGIGGGIISSLIVFFVTKYFFGKKERKEYVQKVETANNEILYSIRPLVIEKKIPTKEILTAIQISTAKKYGVLQSDLYDEFSLCYDLINEIMANSFLSSDQKLEFCALLQSMRDINKSENLSDEARVVYLKDKDNVSKYSSVLLAMTSFATVVTMTLYIAPKADKPTKLFLFSDNFSLFITATLIPILAMTLLYTLRILKRKRKDLEQPDKKDKVDQTD